MLPITLGTSGHVEKAHYDAVVVGARCAGAATAMLLARAGHDVLVLDRAALPSDTTSTHALARGGVVQLARWGLLDEVLDSGAPPIRSVSFHRYDGDTTGEVRRTVKARAGVDLALAPRRYVLDAVLARAAVTAGAELHDRTAVKEIIRDAAGRVCGVSFSGPDGLLRSVSAQFVIGADGVRSRIARLVGAATLEEHPTSGACLYTYVGGAAWDGIEFHLGPKTFAGIFPTHHGEANVWLMTSTAGARPLLSAGAHRTQAWLHALREAAPSLAERVARGHVTDRVRGAVGLPNHVRQATGPGWALVGDAGYHRDPITGHGITDAFRDAELFAQAADESLADHGRESTAMAAYDWRRQQALRQSFRIARELGGFPDAERFTALQVELARVLEEEAMELAALPPIRGGITMPVC